MREQDRAARRLGKQRALDPADAHVEAPKPGPKYGTNARFVGTSEGVAKTLLRVTAKEMRVDWDSSLITSIPGEPTPPPEDSPTSPQADRHRRAPQSTRGELTDPLAGSSAGAEAGPSRENPPAALESTSTPRAPVLVPRSPLAPASPKTSAEPSHPQPQIIDLTYDSDPDVSTSPAMHSLSHRGGSNQTTNKTMRAPSSPAKKPVARARLSSSRPLPSQTPSSSSTRSSNTPIPSFPKSSSSSRPLFSPPRLPSSAAAAPRHHGPATKPFFSTASGSSSRTPTKKPRDSSLSNSQQQRLTSLYRSEATPGYRKSATGLLFKPLSPPRIPTPSDTPRPPSLTPVEDEDQPMQTSPSTNRPASVPQELPSACASSSSRRPPLAHAPRSAPPQRRQPSPAAIPSKRRAPSPSLSPSPPPKSPTKRHRARTPTPTPSPSPSPSSSASPTRRTRQMRTRAKAAAAATLPTSPKHLSNAWSTAAAAAGAAAVRVVNDIDDERIPNLPKDFAWLEKGYITPLEAQLADMDRPNRCKCDGECTHEKGCACAALSVLCPHVTRPYTRDGRVRPELVSWPHPFLVHECMPKCKCGPKCGNVVVQRPRDVELEIFKTSNGRGWGVRALRDLPVGKVLGTYSGELSQRDSNEDEDDDYDAEEDFGGSSSTCGSSDDERDAMERAKDERRLQQAYDFNLDWDGADTWVVSAYRRGNWSRFINHSCEPNLRVFSTTFNTNPQFKELPTYLAFVTTQEIPARTELTVDYNPGYKGKGRKGAKAAGDEACYCGAEECRGFMRGAG